MCVARLLTDICQRDAPSMRAYHHQYDVNVVRAARLEKVTDIVARAYHTSEAKFHGAASNHAIKVDIS